MPAASNAIIRRRRMGSAPSAEVRIVRTLTPQGLDWKERITGEESLAGGLAAVVRLKTKAIGAQHLDPLHGSARLVPC
jgi:hypothetical protein